MAHLQRSENNMPDYLNIARRALEGAKEPGQPELLEDVLKGVAVELWSDAAGCLFIVADEDDAQLLGKPRGIVYTGAELRRVVQIGDPATVVEIHEWKRAFNGRVREVRRRESGTAPGVASNGNGNGGRK
jgi:hypothetical protein